jgi:hypothetical protein
MAEQTISVRFDDLSFLRNMAQRANLSGVDKAQYNEVMDRVMTAQEQHLSRTPLEPQLPVEAITDAKGLLGREMRLLLGQGLPIEHERIKELTAHVADLRALLSQSSLERTTP